MTDKSFYNKTGKKIVQHGYLDEVITQPSYVKGCMNIVNQALQGGYDVLQTEDGNIVTTRNNYIMRKYQWSNSAGELYLIAEESRNSSIIDPADLESYESGASPLDNELYVQKCADFIHEALSKGQDVMQLENGDILTTEMQIISKQYVWDSHTQSIIEDISFDLDESDDIDLIYTIDDDVRL